MKTQPSFLPLSSSSVPFQPTATPSRQGQKLAQDLLHRLLQWLVGDNEPRIRLERDNSEQIYYQVYDPVTRERQRYLTEPEVRIWLEKRYY
ncbi:hypothetical protein K4A83_13285 [Spirulina subsalsa FACHB-351]|uniref:Uncharacterized protein n=1 Tax=Spirulina subsalsa FACHB-351 TaxID=234711 RepID=A0ABT3L6V2_9CYAN|nr:hypothetical protein [Spirulina subsalsa]MCW6037236.1 hypothetical protein [Spirulina subsalsa FACHB-351]